MATSSVDSAAKAANREIRNAMVCTNEARLEKAVERYSSIVEAAEIRLGELHRKTAILILVTDIAKEVQKTRRRLLAGRLLSEKLSVEISSLYSSNNREFYDIVESMNSVDAKKFILESLECYVDSGDIPVVTVTGHKDYENKRLFKVNFLFSS